MNAHILHATAKKSLFVVGFVFLFSLLSFASVFAADKTWDGGGGGDTNMSTAANWDANTLPSAGDRLIFDNTSDNNATWDSSFPSSNSWQVYLNTGYDGTVSISSSTLTIASSTVVSGKLNVADKSLKLTGDLTVAGGTVTSTTGAGTLDMDGSFYLNSGTFQPAFTTTLAGSYIINGGTLSSDSSHPWTLTFDKSTGNQTVTTGTSYPFQNIVINNTNADTANDAVEISGDVAVRGSVTVTRGHMQFSGTTLDFDGNITFADHAQATALFPNSAAITLGGDFITNGASAPTFGSGATLTFDGSDTQTVSSTVEFRNFTVSKSSGNVVTSAAMGTLNVLAVLTVNSGSGLDLATNNTALASGDLATISGTFAWGSSNVTFNSALVINSGATITHGTGSLILANANLTLNATGFDLGNVRMSANVTPSNSFTARTLTVDATKTFTLSGGKTLTIDGTGTVVTNNGTITLASTSTVSYTGASATNVAALTYGNLTLNSSGVTFSAAGNMTTAGTLTVASGTTFSVGTAVVTASAGIANSGTITEASSGYIAKANSSTIITDSGGSEQNTISYTNGTTLYVRVTDEDGNTDGTAADTLSITLSSQLGDTETVTLTETGNATEVFSGSITIRHFNSAAAQSGQLDLNGTSVVTLTYTDSKDSGDTGSDTATLSGSAYSAGGGLVFIYPKNPKIVINNGATTTTVPVVTLSLSVDEATEMVLAEEPTFSGKKWQKYLKTTTYTLSAQGKRTVYVKFANTAGGVSAMASASIMYTALPSAPVPATPPSSGNAQVPSPSIPKDSDGDGLSDEDEMKIGTNKNDPDTDHDGYFDMMEIENGYDPLGPGKLFTVDAYTGLLVKGLTTRTVYYVWSDGKRHAFPTESIYKTWHGSFEKIKTIPDQTLARIPLGNNVRVRPGSRAIKLVTDPKVYFVGKDGVLHWVTSEALMQIHFGAQWNAHVLDIPDGLFPDYTIGTPITQSTQFAESL